MELTVKQNKKERNRKEMGSHVTLTKGGGGI